MMSVDAAPARAAGLRTRPLEETVRDTLAWIQGGDAPTEFPAGLDREKEQAVLDAWLRSVDSPA
jgi:2'-hydroxyisoflavone reductase